ncbi:MAG TPA: hypothetical protein VK363_11985 [Pyrinomonadaceae bacterium]|nr:hypothetical protein [Pyrinomonadaceae bacterium]
MNCYCEKNFPPQPYWQCICPGGGTPANYRDPNNVNGCPSGEYNNGSDCCFPTTAGGGGGAEMACTTPGWNGTCPYGTYPKNGMCCSSGGCSGVSASGSLARSLA